MIKAISVSINFIEMLCEKFPCDYPDKELGKFYSYDITSNRFICCDNSTGDCFVEEYHSIIAVILYFNFTDIPIWDIAAIDKFAFKKDKLMKRMAKRGIL